MDQAQLLGKISEIIAKSFPDTKKEKVFNVSDRLVQLAVAYTESVLKN